jgi:hypothetical protein
MRAIERIIPSIMMEIILKILTDGFTRCVKVSVETHI